MNRYLTRRSMRQVWVACFVTAVLLMGCAVPEPPAPCGVIPSPLQLQWQQMEYYMFIHFGPNTFTDMEWGHGNEDPKVFNPTHLDCRQWAATASAAGMKAIIITAKHHDGFCLWPSNYSTHTVRESAWKDGKGDLLRELSDACREYGLKFGVYLSPWDRNHPTYGTDEYNAVFANTLTEALSRYGDVFEQWFDGANGEGPNGKRQVYDWDLFANTVNKLQPEALIFGSPARNIRWVGNERGYAGTTNWATFTPDASVDGAPTDVLGMGTENGKEWLPAEVDVSIRPGWFYSASTDERVKSVGKLMDIYCSSVGRNSNLLLNVPPDRRGLIHPTDSARLMEFRRMIDASFATNLAKNARITASDTRGGARRYGAANLIDGKYDSYWAVDDGLTAATIEIDLGSEQRFNRLMLQEYIPLGQRVKSFSVECWDGDEWQQITRQTTVGYKRILRFPMVTAAKLRIRIEESLACPVLNEVGVFCAPELLSPVIVTRSKTGDVTLACESNDPVIRYTLDGSEPTTQSERYTTPFALPNGGTVMARAFINGDTQSSETIREEFDIAPAKWSVVLPAAGNRGVERLIDGNPRTACTLPEKEQSATIDLGEELTLTGFTYHPVQGSTGNITRYNFYASPNGKAWKQLQAGAAFDNIQNNPIVQYVRFETPVQARYIKLEAIATVESGKRVSIGDIGILTRPAR